jgi:YtkA-like
MHTGTMIRWTGVLAMLLISIFLMGFEQKGINSEQGFYSVDVQSAGNPVMVGENNMNITVIDVKSMKPLERKLNIEALPWMPAHEHGSSNKPVVTYLGRGKYHIEGITFTMPGDWEIYLKIQDNGKEDSVVFNVPVAP